MKKIFFILWTLMLSAVLSAAIDVRNVEVRSRHPWAGYVDVKFDLDCGSRPSASVTIGAQDRTTGRSLPVNTLWEAGKTQVSNYLVVESGRKHLIWNAGADLPADFRSENVVITVTAVAASDVSPLQYFIIDLSPGPDAESYPKTFIDAIPAEGWTEEFKTTKLVMKCVSPCSFRGLGEKASDWSHTLGSGNWDRTVPVSLSKKYYIGIFEITQKQWELVMGSNPSPFKGDTLPVENVSWDEVRGGNLSAVALNSFVDRIRKRIGYDWFDLPTYAQWECACRAGTETAFNNGKNGSVIFGDDPCITDSAWYNCNSDGTTHEVGLLKPNAWGLYDMHGNVWELCLDTVEPETITPGTVDPVGSDVYDHRGGDRKSSALWSQSGTSHTNWSGSQLHSVGFRLVFTYP